MSGTTERLGRDVTAPWNVDVEGNDTLVFINHDAPVIRVESGPGTGKTYGLVRRVHRIVHPDGLNIDGAEVLVVAFNRVIARDLRSAIEERLVDLPLEKVPDVRTVHSLCLRILGDDIRLIMDHEREAMLYDVRELYPQVARLYPRYNEIAQALRQHEAGHEHHPQLWQAAQEWMLRHRCLSISEVPSLVRDRLQGGDLSTVQYSHVIIDEFQDLTDIERDLLLRLIGETGSLVVLGDSRQSIYAFRGNVRDGLANLGKHPFTSGKTVMDFSNYRNRRCPRSIVEAANNLMSLSTSHAMIPESTVEASLHVVTWTTPTAEAKGMAARIQDGLRKYPNDRHLVLVTRRMLGFMLKDELYNLDPSIAVHIVFSESILERWPAREAFLLFSLIADPDPATWRAWFGYQVPDTADGGESTFRAPKRNAVAYLQFLSNERDQITDSSVQRLAGEPRKQSRGEGGARLWDRAQRYLSLRAALGDNDLSPADLIDLVFGATWWKAVQSLDEVDLVDLDSLRQAALGFLNEEEANGQADEDPKALLRHVARHLRHQVAMREPFVTADHVDIPIYTLWGGKGLTADHVYLIGTCDEAIPGAYDDSYPGTENDFVQEQQRLMYVSITRPRRSLVISRPTKVRLGEAKRLGLAVRQHGQTRVTLQMSRYMRSIQRWLPDAVAGESWGGID